MVKNKKSFTLKNPLIIALCGVGLFVMSMLGSIAVLHYVTPHYAVVNQATTTTASQPKDEACKLTDGVQVCLSSSKKQLSSSDIAILNVTITNTTHKAVAQSYECSPTPIVALNGHYPDTSVDTCGLQVQTPDKMLQPGATATAEFKLSGSLLKSGTNTVKATWQQWSSDDLMISKSAITKDELARQFTNCQKVEDGADLHNAPHYCTSILVMLKSSVSPYNCTAWHAYLAPAGLTVPCTETMNSVTQVYVPLEDSTEWLNKVKALPQVERATTDESLSVGRHLLQTNSR